MPWVPPDPDHPHAALARTWSPHAGQGRAEDLLYQFVELRRTLAEAEASSRNMMHDLLERKYQDKRQRPTPSPS